MILDKLLSFFDHDAFDAVSVVVDMSVVNAGMGEPLAITISGEGVTGPDVVVTLSQSDVDTGVGATPIFDAPVPAVAINEGLFFHVPTEHLQYLLLAIPGLTAGEITAGIVIDTQTNT